MSRSLFGGRNFMAAIQMELLTDVTTSLSNNDKILVMIEAYSVQPEYYNIETLKTFKYCLTWNSKVYEMFKDKIKIYLIEGFPLVALWGWGINPANAIGEQAIKYEDKINGICLVSNIQTEQDANEGGIGYKRMAVMANIKAFTDLIVDVYGRHDCGGGMYRGHIGTFLPEYSSVDIWADNMAKVLTVNKYKFALTFENCYHPIWSWDYITEKIFDTFKSKTVAIYYGCYNIEQKIPKELYIDYRDFNNDEELSKYLMGFSMQQYIDMTEGAYEFYIKQQPYCMDHIKKILKELK